MMMLTHKTIMRSLQTSLLLALFTVTRSVTASGQTEYNKYREGGPWLKLIDSNLGVEYECEVACRVGATKKCGKCKIETSQCDNHKRKSQNTDCAGYGWGKDLGYEYELRKDLCTDIWEELEVILRKDGTWSYARTPETTTGTYEDIAGPTPWKVGDRVQAKRSSCLSCGTYPYNKRGTRKLNGERCPRCDGDGQDWTDTSINEMDFQYVCKNDRCGQFKRYVTADKANARKNKCFECENGLNLYVYTTVPSRLSKGRACTKHGWAGFFFRRKTTQKDAIVLEASANVTEEVQQEVPEKYRFDGWEYKYEVGEVAMQLAGPGEDGFFIEVVIEEGRSNGIYYNCTKLVDGKRARRSTFSCSDDTLREIYCNGCNIRRREHDNPTTCTQVDSAGNMCNGKWIAEYKSSDSQKWIDNFKAGKGNKGFFGRRLLNQPKTHASVLEALFEEIHASKH